MLEVKGVTKLYPGVKALDNVEMTVEPGTVHGLMGENGAGKSTLMKILAGTVKPDSGNIHIDGESVQIHSVEDSHAQGISIVYQELSLFNNLSVAQNIFVMREPIGKSGFSISDRKMEVETDKLLRSFGIEINSSLPVLSLSIAERQLIEIIKAIRLDPKILILDEPTSSLSDEEVKILFSIIGHLKEKGCAIIYITHKMSEVFTICDEVTVFRDGKYIGTEKVENVDQASLVKMMIGRDLQHAFPEMVNSIQEDDALRVENLTNNPFYHDISFHVKKGEIYGLYGLVGSGRTEIMKGLFGVLPKKEGRIVIHGKEINVNTPTKAINSGMAFVTENRKEEGLILTSSIEENISMVCIDHVIQHGFINRRKESELAKKHVKGFRIKTPSTDQMVNNLSGGNQQKVVLAKWFEHNPDIFILDEPTRGIDVGAKFEIYQVIQELVKTGVAVILISSELPEIMNLCHRVGLVRNNSIIHDIQTDKITEDQILMKLTE
ncbi:sugar ABC transporter ATP-binding protein [Oceanispirochaeta crateris]|nr:sugar ABC transporter ATP-binding protein [Oceanispirochaeta crateris]